jgi:hypothetical protein
MMKKLIFPILLLFLISCEYEIMVDLGDVQPELVVNGLIQPQGLDSLRLSCTFVTNYKEVSGASVVVTQQADTIGRYVEKSKGRYCYEGESFQEKNEYTLRIQHPNYPSVLAQTTVPAVPDFWFGTFLDNNRKVKKLPAYSDGNLQVLLEFEDDKTTNNYYSVTAAISYEIKYRVGWPEERDSIVVYTGPVLLNSRSPIIEMTKNSSYYSFAQLSYDWETYYGVSKSEIIFSDKLFNGQKVTLPVDTYFSDDSRIISNYLTLTAISEEYYQMLRAFATREKNANAVFPEALQMYSNVKNGHGVWGAKSSKTVSLDITGMNLFTNE